MHDAADEMIRLGRHAELALGIAEHVAVALPERSVYVAAIAGEIGERLGHEGRAQPVLLGDRLHHVFEEGVFVGSAERAVVCQFISNWPFASS